MVRLPSAIRALAQDYVLLRPGNMRGLDLTIFDFDYDLPWYALFLTAEGVVLGRFGGRDAATPAKYQTMPGLRHALAEALQRFHAMDRKKNHVSIHKPIYVEDYPAASKQTVNSCIHCHHVYEYRRDHLQRQKRWTLDDAWVYPQPENLGLTLDTFQGNRILQVQPDSAAARAGLLPQDALHRINHHQVASGADVQYALHLAPKKGALPVVWHHGTVEKKAILHLPENWRQTDLSWRWSLKSMSPSPGMVGDDLDLQERQKLGLLPGHLAYRHMSFLPPAARHAGLQTNDIILGLGDQVFTMTAVQFETHIRLHYRVGDEITLNVLRGKERLKLRLQLPE